MGKQVSRRSFIGKTFFLTGSVMGLNSKVANADEVKVHYEKPVIDQTICTQCGECGIGVPFSRNTI